MLPMRSPSPSAISTPQPRGNARAQPAAPGRRGERRGKPRLYERAGAPDGDIRRPANPRQVTPDLVLKPPRTVPLASASGADLRRFSSYPENAPKKFHLKNLRHR